MIYVVEKLEREQKSLENQIISQSIKDWEQYIRIRAQIEGIKTAIEIVKEASRELEFEEDDNGS